MATRSATVADHAAPSLPIDHGSTGLVIVDHDAGRILGVAIAEIGSGPAAIRRREVDAFLRCINATSTARPERKAAFVRKALSANPEGVDSFLGIFWGPDGNREHLHGVKCPVVRLGHPARHEAFRLDLIEQPGTVIGNVKNGRLQGEQLLADIHLLAAAPIAEWDDVRCTLLSLAARNPWSMGVSVAFMHEPALLPVACDLVRHPCMRNGLLGYPPARIQSIGRPARATAKRIRALDLVYSWLAGPCSSEGGSE